MPSAPWATTPGELLALIRANAGLTRQQLLGHTGMSRSTLYGRLERLERSGLISESDERFATGGRPAEVLKFDARDRVVLTVDIGHHRAAVSVCDVTGRRLSEQVVMRSVDDLAQLVEHMGDMGEQLLSGLPGLRLLALGVALPAPVDTHTGRVLASVALADPDFPVAQLLGDRFAVDVVVENDARALTLGAATEVAPMDDDGVMIGVKFSTGIGLGLITGGRIMRGSRGAAGDLGHLLVTPGRGPLCTCGRRGCLAAHVAGRALVRDVARPDVTTVSELAARYDADDPDVVSRVHKAARMLGVHLGGFVQVTNPQHVAFGGVLGGRRPIALQIIAAIQEELSDRIAGMTEFRVVNGEHTTASGLVALALDHALAPQRIDAQLVG